MAAPSTPVIQNVSPAYWFGSNVHAEWVTLADVTSCTATLTKPDSTTQSVTVSSSPIGAYTTRWVATPAPTASGNYILSVTATNQDGTSGAGTATFMVIDYPVMVISPADGSTVTGLPLDLSWVISDSTGVATQRIRITDSDGETMYSIEPPNTIRQLSLGVADLAGIEDGASYTIWLAMTNGVGLSMSAHSTITTSWQPPVTPTATVSTDPDTLAASVTVTGDRTYTFTDVESFTAPESGVITSLTVDGKSVQDGTPTPSAPVAIESVGDGGSFAIDVSGTTTTIQATLRSLPDGTHDELAVDSAGVVTLTQRVGYVEYDGSADESWSSNNASGVRFLITIPTAVKSAQSDTSHGLAMTNSLPLLDSGGTGVAGADGFTITSASQLFASVKTALPSITTTSDWTTWLSSNPMTVLYPLATEQTITLGTITPPFVAEGLTVTIDAAVTPTFDATMRAAQSAGTPLTDTLMVVRVNPDGTRHVLADDLESGDSVTDPLPPLGVEYAYEVTGIAATGVPSIPASIPTTITTTYWAMNFGTGAAEVVLARFNPKASYSVEQGGELYHFADGGEGDGLPVWYSTTERDVSGADTWDTLTHATADRLDALMRRYPVGWLRDPFGHRWRARMKPKFSHGIGKLWQVSVDWDAVRWVEA